MAGAREPVWAAACVLEDERRVAELADTLAEKPAPGISAEAAAQAVLQTELGRGLRLSERQAEVAKGLLTSGHSLDLVIGVAGSGKTTTLSAVRAGFEAAGYRVIGAATSGQAAKALEEGAGVPRVRWRRSPGASSITGRRSAPRHVLVLDEGGMTSDAEVAKLLGAVEASGARAVIVGDYRQLTPSAPAAPSKPWPHVTPTTSGRSGTTCASATRPSATPSTTCEPATSPSAVGWYALQRPGPPALRAGDRPCSRWSGAWAFDSPKGKTPSWWPTTATPWRRSTGPPGRCGRSWGISPGRSWKHQAAGATGPATGWSPWPPGRAAPGSPPSGPWSPRSTRRPARWWPLHPKAPSCTWAQATSGPTSWPTRTASPPIAPKGQTVDVTYALEDGGGRELAYVAMSRARGESHVHVVAPDLRQAAQRLAWDWGQERRQAWALNQSPEERLAQLYLSARGCGAHSRPTARPTSTRRGASCGPSSTTQPTCRAGTGRWAVTALGEAARALCQAAADYQRASRRLEPGDLGPGAGTRHAAS